MELIEERHYKMDSSLRKVQLQECLSQHNGLLFKVVNSFCTEPSDKDDLMQEIAIQLWHALPSFKGEAKLSTWIYKTALYTAITWSRKHKRHSDKIADIELNDIPEPQSENDQVQWLYMAIRQLDALERSLTLLYLDGYPYQEIASIMGVSTNLVGVKINRIKQKLTKLGRA